MNKFYETYIKEHRKALQVAFYDKDYELLNWLKTKGNMSKYVKNLLEQEKAKEEKK